MFVLWVLLLVGVGWVLLRVLRDDGISTEPQDSPLDVLKRRYAEGEITAEEYEARKERLQRDR